MTRKKKRRKAAPPSSPVPSRPWLLPALAGGAFAAMALALYWGSLRYPLVFDDINLEEAFFRRYRDFTLRPRQLSYQTYSWTYALAGTDWLWHRLVNVLLHAAAASALFQLLARLFQVLEVQKARSLAFFGAGLFLLHPVAAYSVAYLIQRPIVMATLFSLISLSCFLEGLIRRSAAWYVAAALLYVAAVLSKEHAVALPAVAAALVVLVRGKPSRHTLAGLALPFTLFAGIGLAIAFSMRGIIGAAYETWILEARARVDPGGQLTSPAALYAISAINQGYLFFRYLLLWLVPYPGWMSIDLRTAFPAGLFAWPQSAGMLAYLAYPFAAGALLLRGGRTGLVGFGLLYPWLLSLTELATVRLQEPFVLYRAYLWMSGLPAVLPALVPRVPPKWSMALLAAACVALAPIAHDRIQSFSSPLKLWDDAVRKNGDSLAPLVERAYVRRGLALLDARRVSDAMRDFERALQINPNYADAHLGRFNVHQIMGMREQARQDFERAIALSPLHAGNWVMRCNARVSLGFPDEAREECKTAAAQHPENAEVREHLRNIGGPVR